MGTLDFLKGKEKTNTPGTKEALQQLSDTIQVAQLDERKQPKEGKEKEPIKGASIDFAYKGVKGKQIETTVQINLERDDAKTPKDKESITWKPGKAPDGFKLPAGLHYIDVQPGNAIFRVVITRKGGEKERTLWHESPYPLTVKDGDSVQVEVLDPLTTIGKDYVIDRKTPADSNYSDYKLRMDKEMLSVAPDKAPKTKDGGIAIVTEEGWHVPYQTEVYALEEGKGGKAEAVLRYKIISQTGQQPDQIIEYETTIVDGKPTIEEKKTTTRKKDETLAMPRLPKGKYAVYTAQIKGPSKSPIRTEVVNDGNGEKEESALHQGARIPNLKQFIGARYIDLKPGQTIKVHVKEPEQSYNMGYTKFRGTDFHVGFARPYPFDGKPADFFKRKEAAKGEVVGPNSILAILNFGGGDLDKGIEVATDKMIKQLTDKIYDPEKPIFHQVRMEHVGFSFTNDPDGTIPDSLRGCSEAELRTKSAKEIEELKKKLTEELKPVVIKLVNEILDRPHRVEDTKGYLAKTKGLAQQIEKAIDAAPKDRKAELIELFPAFDPTKADRIQSKDIAVENQHVTKRELIEKYVTTVWQPFWEYQGKTYESKK